MHAGGRGEWDAKAAEAAVQHPVAAGGLLPGRSVVAGAQGLGVGAKEAARKDEAAAAKRHVPAEVDALRHVLAAAAYVPEHRKRVERGLEARGSVHGPCAL